MFSVMVEFMMNNVCFHSSHQPFVGFMIYDGPVHLKNVWFSGFKENINYTSGAIGFLRKDYYSINPTNTVMNAKFDFVDGVSLILASREATWVLIHK